jgi:hypothetical protein
MKRRESRGTRQRPPVARRALHLVAVVAAAYVACGLVGWLTAPGQKASRQTAGRANAAAQAEPAPRKSDQLRLVRLRAQDGAVAVDDLKRLSAPEVARFAAKKWTDMLAFARDAQRDYQVTAALDEYFAGWLTVTDQSLVYSNDQLGESLHLELCRRPEQERQLLAQMAPTIAALATGHCPLN